MENEREKTGSPAAFSMGEDRSRPQEDMFYIKKAMKGDESAFRVLVDRHYQTIYNLFLRLLGARRQEAEDLTQEVFLRAWRGIGSFSGSSKFTTWLYRISINFFIQEQRKRHARKRSGRTFSLDAPVGNTENLYINPASKDPGPLKKAISAELEKAIYEGIEELPGEMRTIIVLRDMQDKSYEEIAEILDIPVGTVRSRLHRARTRLKERLEKYL